MARKTKRKATRSTPKGLLREASAVTQRYAKSILAPLARKETDNAIKLALELVLRDAALSRDRLRIYGPFLRIEKPKQRGGAPVRSIWVRIRDRDRHVTHEVWIEAEKVIKHLIDTDANPPFSNEEREDARRLISNDPKLGRLVARKDIEVEWFAGEHGHGRVIAARLVRVKDNRVIEEIAETQVQVDDGVIHERRSQP